MFSAVNRDTEFGDSKDAVKDSPKKWTSDSGVCITDSGISIDDNYSSSSAVSIHEEDVNEDTKHIPLTSLSSSAVVDAYNSDKDGDTFLHLAIIQGLHDVSRLLIRSVTHPDLLDQLNNLLQTPLHLAALTNEHKVVRHLVISGATVDLRDKHGNTALHLACREGHIDCVEAILSPISAEEVRDCVINYDIGVQRLSSDLLQMSNYEGFTCLHLAALNGSKKIIDLLVRFGADINAREGKSGKSVLHWAVESQKFDFIQFLVKRCYANVNVKSYAARTPLYLAWSLLTVNPANQKLRAIVHFLRDCGAEPKFPVIDSESSTDSSEEEE